MNDTTRRFLTAIVDRVPIGGAIVELRLFPAIRQGGMESGVAVVAVALPASIAPTHAPAGDGGGLRPEVTAPSASALDGEDATTGASDARDAVAQAPDRSDMYASTAHALVDTDITDDDEEGTVNDAAETTSSFVPVADAAREDEIGAALDAEMNEIVVHAARDVRAAESRAFAAASGGHAAVEADESLGAHFERRADVERHVEPVADGAHDDSPYADEAGPADVGRRKILGDAPSAHDHIGVHGAGAHSDRQPPADHVDRSQLADMAEAGAPGVLESVALSDILALPAPKRAADAVAAEDATFPIHAAAPVQRYAILSARYRLTIKGPDRGKWDVEITHEADAPLAIVERVARGVAKRAGEEAEPEHFSAESLRLALEAPAWVTTP